ncbi:MAG TPA: ABC transporter substrate-binding protein [Solirubrobacteraceae bacterium]|jgi:peptide/nickel transport system substrate-binding protein|nr:ABC transporter substrate-binding protein [Solirubrobacteraceae bacterium]
MSASAGLAGVLMLGLAACGSSSTSVSGGSGIKVASGIQTPLTQARSGGKRGGTLTVLDHADFEHLDPGQAYFNLDYELTSATQRPLYSYKPNTFAAPSPDMASEPAQISADGKTITIHIRHGVRFSPPVNREVTSADVAYAIERGKNPNVNNPYFESYFSSLAGAGKATGGPFPGITTPDKYTIVLHLTEPRAQIVLDALVLPLSAPVPKEFASKFDAKKPTEYGNYLVATGPYMLKSDGAGKVLGVGYQQGKSATLVRNPNWNASTDSRPAYLDQINVQIGGDTTVIGRQVLEGSGMVQNDTPAQSIVKLAYEKFRTQLEISPGAGDHYIAVDNKQGPFSNVNVRKALWAALDREAMDKARGGELVTNVMTHFIYPEIPGFEAAGGLKGPQADYNAYPQGNPTLAAKYMKLAGYASGKYTGSKTLQVVGSTGSPSAEDAEIVNQTLKNLGFKTRFNLVDSSVMYSKYCGVPAEAIDVCPSVGWGADFGDPQAVLDVPFNGKNIIPSGNNNWGLVNDPEINKAMDAAESVLGTQARATAWAAIDRKLVAQAAAIPFDWDKQPNIEASNVAGVGDLWDTGEWDYSYTSLK